MFPMPIEYFPVYIPYEFMGAYNGPACFVVNTGFLGNLGQSIYLSRTLALV